MIPLINVADADSVAGESSIHLWFRTDHMRSSKRGFYARKHQEYLKMIMDEHKRVLVDIVDILNISIANMSCIEYLGVGKLRVKINRKVGKIDALEFEFLPHLPPSLRDRASRNLFPFPDFNRMLGGIKIAIVKS